MTTMEKVYLDAQAACGLKVGDYVKLLRTSTYDEAGWNSRKYDMQYNMLWRVGEVYKIIEIGNLGVALECNNLYNYFPYFVLEKVEKPKYEFKPFDKVLVRDSNAADWRCNLFSNMSVNGLFICVGSGVWGQCISYEGNEHLVGTINMPEE